MSINNNKLLPSLVDSAANIIANILLYFIQYYPIGEKEFIWFG
jgi:hypothetical protein